MMHRSTGTILRLECHILPVSDKPIKACAASGLGSVPYEPYQEFKQDQYSPPYRAAIAMLPSSYSLTRYLCLFYFQSNCRSALPHLTNHHLPMSTLLISYSHLKLSLDPHQQDYPPPPYSKGYVANSALPQKMQMPW